MFHKLNPQIEEIYLALSSELENEDGTLKLNIKDFNDYFARHCDTLEYKFARLEYQERAKPGADMQGFYRHALSAALPLNRGIAVERVQAAMIAGLVAQRVASGKADASLLAEANATFQAALAGIRDCGMDETGQKIFSACTGFYVTRVAPAETALGASALEEWHQSLKYLSHQKPPLFAVQMVFAAKRAHNTSPMTQLILDAYVKAMEGATIGNACSIAVMVIEAGETALSDKPSSLLMRRAASDFDSRFRALLQLRHVNEVARQYVENILTHLRSPDGSKALCEAAENELRTDAQRRLILPSNPYNLTRRPG